MTTSEEIKLYEKLCTKLDKETARCFIAFIQVIIELKQRLEKYEKVTFEKHGDDDMNET